MNTAHEVILSYMKLSENKNQVGYPLLYEALDLSWYELFKKTKESKVEKWVEVTNGIANYPKSLETLFGIYVVDSCGDLAAFFEDNQKNIVPIPATKCTCNSCDKSDCMCPKIQDSIRQTEVIIEGEPHTNKTVTRVLKNGEVVEETYTWAPVFDSNGVFVRAEEIPSQKTKCNLETKPCGCPIESDENVKKLFNCGCIDYCEIPSMRENYPALVNNFGYYKKDDEARQVHLFTSEGKKSRVTQVLVVFESNGADMLVPKYAKKALIALLDWTRKQFSPSFLRDDKDQAKRFYIRCKKEMIQYLNPIPFEWYMAVADPRKNAVNQPYYRGVHSDFIKPETVAICAPTTPANNVTNITYTTSNITNSFLKVVVGGTGGPVAGTKVFQHNSLKGLGSKSNDKVEFVLDKIDMYNWGASPDFALNKVLGTITLLNGLEFQTASTIKVDLNQ